MELKVWVEGIQRIVCGVTERTTCQDVVYALAHATGKTGRFTLIERWRNNERLLAPHEHPLKVLMKWGEYSNDVHLILQRTSLEAVTSPSPAPSAASASTTSTTSAKVNSHNGFKTRIPTGMVPVDLKKSPRAVPAVVGVVRPSLASPLAPTPTGDAGGKSPNGLNGSLTLLPPQGSPYSTGSTTSDSKSSSTPNGRCSLSPGRPTDHRTGVGESPRAPPPYRNPPPPMPAAPSSGMRLPHPTPPPYREPPRPNGTSPASAWTDAVRSQRNLNQDLDSVASGCRNGGPPSPLADPESSALIQLVNRQRERLDEQHELLVRLERDTGHLEEQLEWLRQQQQLCQEADRLEQLTEQQEEEIDMLAHVQVQWEALSRDEDQLHRQLEQTRSDIRKQESQLEAYHQTIRKLKTEVEREEAALEQLTCELEAELAGARADLEVADDAERRLVAQQDDANCQLSDAEADVRRLHDQIQRLTLDIKEANLQSLSIAPADDLKILLEAGNFKSGHGRRMLGSPRQLETAVPTNKNPHGVWV